MRKILLLFIASFLFAIEHNYYEISDNNKTFYLYLDQNKTPIVDNWQFLIERLKNQELLFAEVASLNSVKKFNQESKIGLDFICDDKKNFIMSSIVIANIPLNFGNLIDKSIDVKMKFDNKKEQIVKFHKLNPYSIATMDKNLIKLIEKSKKLKVSLEFSDNSYGNFKFDLNNTKKAISVLQKLCNIKN